MKERRYGEWYKKAIVFSNKLFNITKNKIEQRVEVAQEKYGKDLKQINSKIKKLSEETAGLSPTDKKARSKNKEIERLEKKKKIVIQRQLKKNFTEAVESTGLQVSEYEVVVASSFYSFIFFISLLMLSLLLWFVFNFDLWTLFIYFFVPIISGTLGLFSFLANYPEILSKRLMVKLIGSSPEAVTYMCVSMKLNNSLNKSISFASKNTREPLSSRLNKILWNVYIKKYNSIEESFINFAQKIGKWNEDFKRSLYFIRVASLEKTKDGVSRVLDKAHRTIIEGTQAKIKNFASSLSGPSMVFFAMGIMLPLVIGAMLPMMSLNPLDLTTNLQSGGGTDELASSGDGTNPIPIIFLMNIFFPLMALLYAYHILGKRPGVSLPPKMEERYNKKKKIKLIGILLVISILVALFAVPAQHSSLLFTIREREREKYIEKLPEGQYVNIKDDDDLEWLVHSFSRNDFRLSKNAVISKTEDDRWEVTDQGTSFIIEDTGEMLRIYGPNHFLTALPPIWGVTIFISGYCGFTSYREWKKRKNIEKLEKEFPDALYQLGSRISEGIPLEKTLKMTAKNLEGTKVSELFYKIAYNLHVSKKSLKETLFGATGLLSDHPSENIHAYMRMVVDVENKDPAVSGELIMSSASYLRDLKNTEDDMKTELQRIMNTMNYTAILFSPIILGITGGLYLMLSDITVRTGLSVGMIVPWIFFSILGVYIVAFVLIVMYFSTGIESGEDDYTMLKYRIGVSLPIAVLVFSLSLLSSNLMFA